MSRERRKYPRVEIKKTQVKMQEVSKNTGGLREGMIKGISAGGVGINMAEPFDAGDVVVMNFSLDEEYDFKAVKGRIIRVEKSHFDAIVGIQFMEIAEDDLLKIKEYVKSKFQNTDKDSVIAYKNMVIFR